jgi:argininosuccinate lyase
MSTLPVWATRTGAGLDAAFAAFSQTIADDAPFLAYDLMGSVAHVKGLAHVGLLDPDDAATLQDGLHALHKGAGAGTWQLDPALEDVHMNIEAALHREVGAVAARLHTGRSRNDQVATCITLYARDGLARLAAQAADLAAALAAQANAQAATPWVARTHGRPAQPATLGFLLAAHAWRIQDAARQALAAFDAVGESPLGAGAVAGSTLPLDAAYTAGLMGLRPYRNALLATGGRDTVLVALAACTTIGAQCASLAQDLLDLFERGILHLPPGFTTGSSLMPHKRNPDALELVRGHGKALGGVAVQAQLIVAGLGLGYQRDLQATKPLLVNGLHDGEQVLVVLTGVVEGASFDAAAATRSLAAPGITATDAAEALVAGGMPFRDAYTVLARHAALVESGVAPDEAVTRLGLAPQPEAAVRAALVPDVTRRAAHGGPAPDAVRASVVEFRRSQHAIESDVAAAMGAAAIPHALLETRT